ncbi:hypothetical protein AB0L53_03325 [Nonomuraea sp. NPDC052129]|uniref:hypothetical protein n=1 Tax=Nonomuraea sp. NPDC052129 TaxID=3154651 RepID=UPI00341D26DC
MAMTAAADAGQTDAGQTEVGRAEAGQAVADAHRREWAFVLAATVRVAQIWTWPRSAFRRRTGFDLRCH